MSGFEFVGDEDDLPAAADNPELVGVQENTSGIAGLCVLYEAAGRAYRVRLRPENPLDTETFDRGDVWTVYEWAEVEEPTEQASVVAFEELYWVPEVVRETIPGVVQVPDLGGSR